VQVNPVGAVRKFSHFFILSALTPRSPLLEQVLPQHLFDRVYTAANDPYFTPPDPGFLPTWNGATGEHLKDVPLLRMIRCSRRKLRALCAENIDVKVSRIVFLP
jgi:hypothetical protein